MDKNKKGFSLLELLLVLGIIAALVVSAFVV
ncbi:prepilin-type N-terminal cleavage/methylation domain-containing protein [Klebsiella pneumoniae]|nr:prepilin-type N-terminal cleavage/methylation domain-containing protein [Klebsiella pneumoniae]MBA8099332.1 prepilin-type N-terminal cleavage/methylation domain-containing protein [Klebsiella pneumoniae]QMA08626.1 prepilin-type N-terminal cleavage/methylation domain-containing protein [Klebsiella pneumoniae]QMA13857.1 prepilin-type N-terminal cleavage/methylation domain-containing protein [Klebsiella pneumoniae]